MQSDPDAIYTRMGHGLALSAPMASSSCSNLVLASLNFVILLLSSASLVPVLLLRNPPTGYGWALAGVSIVTVLSSSVGLYSSRVSRCCFSTHLALVLVSIVGQALGFSALFLREELSMEMLGASKGKGEVRALYKAEEGAVVGMFLLQSLVLTLTCAVQSRWVGEREEAAAAAVRRRSRRMVRVQEEAVVDASVVVEMDTGGGDEETGKRGRAGIDV